MHRIQILIEATRGRPKWGNEQRKGRHARAKEKKSLDDRMGAKSDSVSNIRFPVAASERAVDHDGGLHSRATSALHKDRTFHRPVQKSCFAIRR